MTPQQALNRYAIHQDADAFRFLVDQYQRLVYSAARRRLGHSHDIDDVVQITFLKLAQAASTLKQDSQALAAWLYTTALNAANDLIRRDNTRLRHESFTAIPDVATLDQDKLEIQRLSHLVDDALLTLPPGQQNLLIEHFFQNRSQRDLARSLSTSQSSIKRRIAEAIEALRQKLAPAAGVPALVPLTLQQLPAYSVPMALTHELTKIGLAIAPTKAVIPVLALSLGAKLAFASAALVVVALVAAPFIPWTQSAPKTAPVPTVPAPAVALPASDLTSGLDYTRVSVNFDNLTPSEAITAFSSQTGYPISHTHPAVVPPLSLHLRDKPLLEAFFQLTQNLNAGIMDFGPFSASIDSTANIKKLGPVSVTGPCAIMLNTPSQPIRFDSNITYRHLNLAHFSIDCYTEPLTHNLLFPHIVTLTDCKDDLGQAITLDPLRPLDPDVTAQYSRARLQINIILPDSPGKLIPSLKGSAIYSLVTATQSFETPGPAELFKANLAEASVEIRPFELRHPQELPEINQYRTRIRFRRNQMKQEAWDAQLEHLRQVRITISNAAGQPIRFSTTIDFPVEDVSTGRGMADTLEITCTTIGDPAEGPAHHLTLLVATETRPVSIPFEFKNLPLTPPTTAPTSPARLP